MEKYDFNPDNLRRLCDATNSRRDILSDAIGISIASLIGYLSGKTSPNLPALIKLADFFAVPIDVIMGRMSVEESEEILKDYSHTFMKLRKAPYEAYLMQVSQNAVTNIEYPAIDLKHIDSPYPYNLIDAIFCEPIELLMTEDRMKGLEKAIGTLTEREQKAIRMRFEEGMFLKEIGKEFGVTQERMRQIVAKAIRKLRHPARCQYIKYGAEGAKIFEDLKQKEERLAKQAVYLEKWEKDLTEREKNLDKNNDNNIDTDSPRTGESVTSPLLDMDIASLELSVRSFNCLRRVHIDTFGDIVNAAEQGKLTHIRNFGRQSLKEILYKLKYYGYDYFDQYNMLYKKIG